MFQRPAHTYETDFEKLDPGKLLREEASPLRNILDILPDGARILDVGAGNGMLGWLIRRARPGVVADGVEPSAAGAELARGFYRNFHCARIEEVKDWILREDYDYIVLADVIEHVADPLEFLRSLTEGISERTRVILSVPNVAHYSVRLELLNGNFRYVDSGLLERTHLRFFTLETILDVASRLQLNVESIRYLRQTPSLRGLKQRYRLSWWSYLKLFGDRDALTYQYLLVLGRGTAERKDLEKGRLSRSRILKTMFLRR